MNDTRLSGSKTDGIIRNNAVMETLEALLPTGGYPSAHAPALLETPNGDMLCAWFAGACEGAAGTHIVCSRLPAGAEIWTKPVDVSCDLARSEQNPSLFFGSDGAVWCVYTSQQDRRSDKDNMQYTAVVRCQKSFDDGKTWGPFATMFPEEGVFARQPIQVLSNGRWIFGNWICSDSENGLADDYTIIRISDDQGGSWRKVALPRSRGRVHPNVVEMEPGRLSVFLRSRAADFIYRAASDDYGDTWSEPVPTPLPNNNASISAIKLGSGRIAIAYNPTCSPVKASPDKAVWPGLRCPIAVALSEDGGVTFPIVRWMEQGEGYMGEENRTNNKQYEYPCFVQGRDGTLTLVYAAFTRKCIKMVRFSEADVLGRKREKIDFYNPTTVQNR